MELRAGARWVDPAHPWSTPTVVKVADAGSEFFQSSREESSGASGCQPSIFKQSRSRPRGSGLQCTSESGQIGGRDVNVGRVRPNYSTLQDALKKAKAQVHVRPVDERIASSKTFIERAKKRIGVCRTEIVKAQEALAQAQARLQSEEQGLAEGEVRLAALIAESEGLREEVPHIVPANFAHELAELRGCMQDLQRENTELRSQLQSSGRGGEERERKQPRNLSHSSLDLVPLSRSVADAGHGVGQSQPILNAGRADVSSRMETLIDTADASLRSNRFNPLSG